MDTIGQEGSLEVKPCTPEDEMSLETHLTDINAMTDRIMGCKTIAVLAIAQAEMDPAHPERIKTMVITRPGTTLDASGRTLYFCLGATQMMAMDGSPIVEPTKN